jgi:hypothetical protein
MDDDPRIAWLREQVDQVFDGIVPTRQRAPIGLVASLAAGLALLSLLVGLAFLVRL